MAAAPDGACFADLPAEIVLQICAQGLEGSDLHRLYALSQRFSSLKETLGSLFLDTGIPDDKLTKEWLKLRTDAEIADHWTKLNQDNDISMREYQFRMLTDPEVCATYPATHLATALLQALRSKNRWLSDKLSLRAPQLCQGLVTVNMAEADQRVMEKNVFTLSPSAHTPVLLIVRLKVHGEQGEELFTADTTMVARDSPPHAVVIALHSIQPSRWSDTIPSVTLVLGCPHPVESLQVSTGQASIKHNWQFDLSFAGNMLLLGMNPHLTWDEMVINSVDHLNPLPGETEPTFQHLLRRFPWVNLNGIVRNDLIWRIETPLTAVCRTGSCALILQVLAHPGLDAAMSCDEFETPLSVLGDRLDSELDPAFEALERHPSLTDKPDPDAIESAIDAAVLPGSNLHRVQTLMTPVRCKQLDSCHFWSASKRPEVLAMLLAKTENLDTSPDSALEHVLGMALVCLCSPPSREPVIQMLGMQYRFPERYISLAKKFADKDSEIMILLEAYKGSGSG